MIILMGSVGSGKTEQGRRLVKKLGCPRISTSRLLQENPSPQRMNDMLAGRLVDDKDIISLLEPALKKAAADKRECILDGAPRSIPQAEWLIHQIDSGKVSLTGVISLKTSDETVLKRLLLRGRPDDKKEIILKRLRDYHKVTIPVLSYLKEKGLRVYYVNGENEPSVVEKEIDKVLGI